MDPITPRAPRERVQDPNTPQRRSLYDLQRLIDEVFDGFAGHEGLVLSDQDNDETPARTCRAKDLPAILTAFEQRRDLLLLDDSEKDLLKAFTEQHPDLDVSSEQLVSLLSVMTASRNDSEEPNSPTRNTNKQLPTPPPSDVELDQDHDPSRSRTSSQSSRSSSSHDSTSLTASGTLDGASLNSSIFDTEPSFPRSYSMPEGVQLASPPGTPIAAIHQRSQTSNDLFRAGGGLPEGSNSSSSSSIPRPISLAQHGRAKTLQHTPLLATISARQRSSPLDLNNESALRRSRPAPPKSRRISGDREKFSPLPHSYTTGSIPDGRRSRQGSEDSALSPRVMSPLEGMTSPLFTTSLDAMHEETADSSFEDYMAASTRPRSRQASYGRGASPLFDTSPPPDSLAQNPLFPPQSPMLDATSYHAVPISPHELMNPHDDFSRGAHQAHTRPVSTMSLGASEAALSEMVQNLQQELARKTQDLEAQRTDSYSLLMEKEAMLEEVRLELIAKRKEEKELRGKEKINLNQIATLEAQTATFRDERDKQKTAYQTARKQYEEQCNESEKLRNVIRNKDEELRLADENLQNANNDLAKLTRERDYLQSQTTRLEEELAEARAAVDALDEQKNENLQLKETIDRLRLDLDELRTQARLAAESQLGTSDLRRSASGTGSVPATLSRNLGRELARRFAGVENEEEGETTDGKTEKDNNDDEFDEEEEIVTTRRRLKRQLPKKSDSNVPSNAMKVKEVVEVCDVQVQVTPPEKQTAELGVQTDKVPELSSAEKRMALAKDLSVDLAAVDEYLRNKKQRQRLRTAEPDTAPPPYQSAPPSQQHLLHQYTALLPREAKTLLERALQSSGNLLAYTFVVFVCGLLTGSAVMPVRHHHHIASVDTYANWAAYNTLDFGTTGQGGWRDSAWYIIEKIVWRGVAISRKVPT